MKTVQDLIVELSNFPVDKEVRFFSSGFSGINAVAEYELVIIEYDQDGDGNPTFLLEKIND